MVIQIDFLPSQNLIASSCKYVTDNFYCYQHFSEGGLNTRVQILCKNLSDTTTGICIITIFAIAGL
jgi:hypothetical protein